MLQGGQGMMTRPPMEGMRQASPTPGVPPPLLQMEGSSVMDAETRNYYIARMVAEGRFPQFLMPPAGGFPPLLSSEPQSEGLESQRRHVQQGMAAVQIALWDKKEGMKVVLEMSPTVNLKEYLSRHPEYEPYHGQDGGTEAATLGGSGGLHGAPATAPSMTAIVAPPFAAEDVEWAMGGGEEEEGRVKTLGGSSTSREAMMNAEYSWNG